MLWHFHRYIDATGQSHCFLHKLCSARSSRNQNDWSHQRDHKLDPGYSHCFSFVRERVHANLNRVHKWGMWQGLPLFLGTRYCYVWICWNSRLRLGQTYIFLISWLLWHGPYSSSSTKYHFHRAIHFTWTSVGNYQGFQSFKLFYSQFLTSF